MTKVTNVLECTNEFGNLIQQSDVENMSQNIGTETAIEFDESS